MNRAVDQLVNSRRLFASCRRVCLQRAAWNRRAQSCERSPGRTARLKVLAVRPGGCLQLVFSGGADCLQKVIRFSIIGVEKTPKWRNRMTLNRLLKTLLNVKGATVDGAEFAESDRGEVSLTVHGHVCRKDQWRCPISGNYRCNFYAPVYRCRNLFLRYPFKPFSDRSLYCTYTRRMYQSYCHVP